MSQSQEKTEQKTETLTNEQQEKKEVVEDQGVDVQELIIPNVPENQKFIEANLDLANLSKTEGNQHFAKGDNDAAIACYQKGLQYTPETQKKLRCILYSNIAINLSKKQDYEQAINYCKKSLKEDDKYLKAQINLAIYQQKVQKLEEALQSYKISLKLSPNDKFVQQKVKELEKKVAQIHQKQKEQVISGLKNIGNSILGYFGMSLDNFKLQQGDGGGYNIQFKQ